MSKFLPTNPVVWLVPGADGIFSSGSPQRAKSVELIYFPLKTFIFLVKNFQFPGLILSLSIVWTYHRGKFINANKDDLKIFIFKICMNKFMRGQKYLRPGFPGERILVSIGFRLVNFWSRCLTKPATSIILFVDCHRLKIDCSHPLFSRIFTRSLNAGIKSLENW